MRKIISGSFTYVSRVSREYVFAGYSIVKSKRWGDGTYTIVLERR